MSQFYEFTFPDEIGPEAWDLKILRDARGEEAASFGWANLTWARHVDIVPPLEIAIERYGRPFDVTFIHGNVPILSSRAADLLRLLAGSEIELIPARVPGQTDYYFAMNIISMVKC